MRDGGGVWFPCGLTNGIDIKVKGGNANDKQGVEWVSKQGLKQNCEWDLEKNSKWCFKWGLEQGPIWSLEQGSQTKS